MQKTLSVINLKAIRHNALKVKELVHGAKLFAVVKADAYGHGAEEVARHIEDIVYGFCVAIIEEGIALRISGITKPILVLTPPLDEYDSARARFYDLSVSIGSEQSARFAKNLNCHIKINTGMNRFGCGEGEIKKILGLCKGGKVCGVYSHLYSPSDSSAELQLKIFKRCARFVKDKYPDAVAHISASGGILKGGEYILDGVRAGILLYGYSPCGFKANGFERALKVYARRAQAVKFIGGGIGYSIARESYDNLTTYRCGYADGFFRGVPLGEGNLCMDSFISKENKKFYCVMDNAEIYAKKCNTIPYEILTNVTKRSKRIYVR